MESIIEQHDFHAVADEDLTFAVIFSKYRDQWVICRQRGKITWEVQGGHREQGEVISYTAARELHEESGANVFRIKPITNYSMVRNGVKSVGQLYYSEIYEIGDLPVGFEIEEVKLVDSFPEDMTYREIHELLYEIIQNHNLDDNTVWHNFELHNEK